MTVTDNILLDTLDQLPGSLLAGVVGLDGLRIEMIAFEDDLPHDREEAEAELSALVAAVNTATERLRAGRTIDMIIQSEDMTYILALIIPGYYAVIGMQPGESVGRARFAINDLVNRLLDEL
jgi:predicted regulator of Ras-like GTPase activity (Roadblock/LC7/MglB family)